MSLEGQDHPLAASGEGEGKRLDGVILGFDFGEKRIGVSVGNLGLRLAHPLETVIGSTVDQQFGRISELIREWRPVRLVVGLPTHTDGKEHELTRRTRRFTRRLESRFRIPAVLVDECYTSIDASTALREAGIKGKKQKPMLDRVAAQLILQTYFDSYDATA